jgi:anti-sigma factor RsiW
MMNQTHPTLEELVDYVHHELSPEHDAAIHAHLAGCAVCSERRDTEVRLGEMLREYAQRQERELPPGLRTRILASAADEPSRGWWFRLSQMMRPVVALPVAAAAGLAIFFGVHALHQGPARQATVQAAYYLEDHAALAATVPFGDGAVIPASFTSDDATADERTVDEPR